MRTEERLIELELPSLQARRKEIDMIQTYKIVNKIDSDKPDFWFKRADSRRLTRQGDGKDRLIPVRTQHEFRKNFFSARRDNKLEPVARGYKRGSQCRPVQAPL